MNIYDIIPDPAEKPLDRLVEGYSFTSIFRKIAFVGDSLSSGEFESHAEGRDIHFYDMYDYSWGQHIARKNGLTAYNFSCGGMTAKEYLDSFAENNGFWDKEKACQAYVIALGVNDIYNGGKKEIGSVDDVKSRNTTTFIGAYGEIIRRYKEISPDAKFFFVTFPDEDDEAKKEQCEAVIKELYNLADYYSNSYVIDLYKYGPVYNKSFKDKFYLYGHMNPMGYILTAQLIDSYIDYIVRHHYNDFKNIAFVNSGL